MMFRVCERFGILPPETSRSWDSMHGWAQALLLAYNAIREQEEQESSPNEAIAIAMATMAGRPRI